MSTSSTTHYQSSDPAEIERILNEELGASVRVTRHVGAPQGFYWSLTHTDAGAVSVEAAESTGFTAQVESLDGLVIVTGERGLMSREWADGLDTVGPGESALAALPGESHRFEWSGELPRASAVRLDLRLLRDVAVSCGGADGADVRFLSRRPLGVAAGRHWQETVAYVGRTLAGSPGRAPSPIVVGESCRFLAAMALATFPNTAVLGADGSAGPDLGGHSGDGSNETLRRAMEFIDAHAGTDIGLLDIAAAACVTPRAVQLAFRRHLDTTPTAYLRSVRLARAHRELTEAAPDSGITVSDVSSRWGFGAPSRFAHYYRETFGVLPSETLAG